MGLVKGLTFTIALSCAAALGGGLAYGQDSSAMDTTFAKNAASGGVAEVKFGQLAQEKGESNTVKEFGKRMQEDHSKADDQLKEVASKDNIAIPMDMDAKDRATYECLSKMSGAEFDRACAHDMLMDHEKDIATFKREANAGKDPDVKDFASQTPPTLEEHLKLAKAMEKTVNTKETSKAKPTE